MSLTECHISGFDIVYKRSFSKKRRENLKALAGNPLEEEEIQALKKSHLGFIKFLSNVTVW